MWLVRWWQQWRLVEVLLAEPATGLVVLSPGAGWFRERTVRWQYYEDVLARAGTEVRSELSVLWLHLRRVLVLAGCTGRIHCDLDYN